jgi:hypothetical protein
MTSRPINPQFICLLQTAPLAVAGWHGTATVPGSRAVSLGA